MFIKTALFIDLNSVECVKLQATSIFSKRKKMTVQKWGQGKRSKVVTMLGVPYFSTSHLPSPCAHFCTVIFYALRCWTGLGAAWRMASDNLLQSPHHFVPLAVLQLILFLCCSPANQLPWTGYHCYLKHCLTCFFSFQTAFSTSPGEGGVMAQQEYDRKHSPHLVSRFTALSPTSGAPQSLNRFLLPNPNMASLLAAVPCFLCSLSLCFRRVYNGGRG